MTTTHILPRAAGRFTDLLPATSQAGFKMPVAGKCRWLEPLAILCCMVNALSADTYGLFTYTVNGGEVTITDYPTDAEGAVVIPAKIPPDTGNPVTRIGDAAFSDCSGLTSVTIPSGGTHIGNNAFYYCYGMTNVTIPDGVTHIGDFAFSYCEGLPSVTIPSSVTHIGVNAFQSCSGLTSVTIPVGVTSIGVETFYACSGLTSVKIPTSVTSIGNTAFGDCSALASVTIPAGVTSIGASAFQNCGGLTSVMIAHSVTSIGNSAFASCIALSTMHCLGNAPVLGTNVFDSSNTFTLYHFNDKAGFDVAPWDACQYVSLGDATPVAPWLLLNGFTLTTDLLTDPNNDGVNLLMAYALTLDPHANLSGSMPKPVIDGTHMYLTFYAGSAGVSYAVESSTDMKDRTWTNVPLSDPPDANQRRTATVDRNVPSRFMRLVVRY
ncbi:MAG: leucine-rich repeat domain-containing protein [Verrucomicrobia bacterium]|nr:leucine-rich repeat domain-containing protein [Verrucomicrobiota bacterium]